MNRGRNRIGRRVNYYATDAEATTAGTAAGSVWPATITQVNRTGTVTLFVERGNGVALAKTTTSRGNRKGFYAYASALV